MNDQDKILTKDSAMVLANAIVDGIAKSIPGINIPWNLSKALYGAGMKLRQQKVLEWVEMVRDNPRIFSQYLWNDEQLQDGFVYALERYLTERSDSKRRIFRNIFLGFAQASDRGNFPLEKFTHTLSQLNEVDIAVLRDANMQEQGQNYQIYGPNQNRIENIYNLINAGLLLDVTGGSRIGHDPLTAPFVRASAFGKEFVHYIVALTPVP